MQRAATYPSSPLFGERTAQRQPATRARGEAVAQPGEAYGWLPPQVRRNLTPRALRLMRSGD
jgi:hypothetical protein